MTKTKPKAIQYVGIDVHQATLVVAVLSADGKLVFESTVATKREAIEQVLRGLTGRVWVAFEEGTQAQWLYDVIVPLVEHVVVCNPRETRQGENKSDRIDARKLADKLRLNALKAVFHNTANVRTFKELVRLYESLVSDSTRSKLRVKAIFRGRAILTPGGSIYDAKKAAELMDRIPDKGTAFRASKLLVRWATECLGRMDLDLPHIQSEDPVGSLATRSHPIRGFLTLRCHSFCRISGKDRHFSQISGEDRLFACFGDQGPRSLTICSALKLSETS